MNAKKMITSLVIGILISGTAALLLAGGIHEGFRNLFTLEGDLYHKAFNSFQGEQFAEAANLFAELAVRKPFRSEPRFLLATTYYKMDNYQEAAAWCENLQRCFPIDVKRMSRSFNKNMVYSQLQYILATSYMNLQRYPEAVEAYQRILDSHNYSVSNTTRDMVYCVLPLERGAFYALVHYQLGATYVSMGDKEAALKEYKKLKKMNPEKSEKLFNLINPNEASMPTPAI